jgi:Pyruvate/2-oxoacid:ferredoxin oxidoreductase delta subunit
LRGVLIMAVRKIVSIDENKCNGCGLCIPNCAEGALQIVDGKAKLVKDIYCDGLGACLGECPADAISIIKREAEEFNEEEVEKFLNKKVAQAPLKTAHIHQGGCPGNAVRQFKAAAQTSDSSIKVSSKLNQWPVQLKLVPTTAQYLKNSDLLITADCVPFAYGNYHNDFLKDKALVVGCPKLDDVNFYTDKLGEIIRLNDLESITVLRMEVPCCSGIAAAAKKARDNAGSDIPVKVITIGIEGDVLKREYL